MPPTTVPGRPGPRPAPAAQHPPAHAPASAAPPGHPTAPLELLGVIPATVPHEGRAARSSRYTVAARLSRSASVRERALIEHPQAHAALAELGFASVRLKVLDRRLLIENTNVHMLERGLAAAIAGILSAVDRQVAAGRARSLREAQLRRAEQVQEREQGREQGPTTTPGRAPGRAPGRTQAPRQRPAVGE